MFDFQVAGDMKKELFNEENSEEFKYPLFANALEEDGLLGYYKEYKYEPNSITVTARGNVGHATVRNEKFNAVGRLIILTSKNDLDMNFFSEYINSNVKVHIESTGVPQLTAPSLKINKLHYPSLNEQTKISNFLLALNKKMELLQKKHDSYVNFKKYLMQQIFAQKLRFAEDDSEWQEITLKDIGTFYRGHSYSSSNVVDDGLLVLRSNNIKNNVLDFSEDGLQFVNKDCKKELELQKNDIVICMSNGTRRLVGKSAEYIGNYPSKLTVGAFCSIFRTNNKLAKYLFQTESYKKNLYLILAGTNINNLKNSDLEKFKFNMPTNESEINKIHDLFTSIDCKIDSNQKQLQEIILFKKGLLQQMFVCWIKLIKKFKAFQMKDAMKMFKKNRYCKKMFVIF
ncbi:MAG: restriction endonuclease subunit S [Methanobrevibacter sp.]|nr:restriction endonuclease subunit S [Methanobrevibacter sp.]